MSSNNTNPSLQAYLPASATRILHHPKILPYWMNRSKLVSKIGKIKRPLNAYLIFRVMQDPRLLLKQNKKLLSNMWRGYSIQEKAGVYQAAAALKEFHYRHFPEYRFQPSSTKRNAELEQQQKEESEEPQAIESTTPCYYPPPSSRGMSSTAPLLQEPAQDYTSLGYQSYEQTSANSRNAPYLTPNWSLAQGFSNQHRDASPAPSFTSLSPCTPLSVSPSSYHSSDYVHRWNATSNSQSLPGSPASYGAPTSSFSEYSYRPLSPTPSLESCNSHGTTPSSAASSRDNLLFSLEQTPGVMFDTAATMESAVYPSNDEVDAMFKGLGFSDGQDLETRLLEAFESCFSYSTLVKHDAERQSSMQLESW